MTFRTQLVIPAQRELFDYWKSRCGERIMPARRDLNPAAFRRQLGFVSLVDVELSPRRYRLRLAGTGLAEIYGQDYTGRYLDDLPLLDQRPLDRVVERRCPAQGVLALRDVPGAPLVQFWLRMPLSDDGSTVNMILGYDVFLHVAQARALSEHAAAASGF